MQIIPRLRFPRFSLRTLFVVVTMFAALAGWLCNEWRIVQHRKAILEEIHAHYGVPCTEEPPQPYSAIRRLFGDEPFVEIALVPGTNDDLLARVQTAFPEAEAYIAKDVGPFGPYLRSWSRSKQRP